MPRQQRAPRRSFTTGNDADFPRVPTVTRTEDENKERAYIAASRRTDRSLDDRIKSAQKASEIHKARTGKALKITREAVEKELMFEEEDDAPRTYAAGYPYTDALGISTARHEQVNREFEQTFGHLVRFQSWPVPGSYTAQGHPWPQATVDSIPQHQYTMGYHTQVPASMPQFAQPGLGAVSQPLPISPMELTEPYRSPVSLLIRPSNTEDSQSSTVTIGPAPITPISNTPSHPYGSSQSPSPGPDTTKRQKRKSMLIDADSLPSDADANRAIKRRPSAAEDAVPVLSYSPDTTKSTPEFPNIPFQRESSFSGAVDPGLADSVTPLPSHELFNLHLLGGEMGGAEYAEHYSPVDWNQNAFDFPIYDSKQGSSTVRQESIYPSPDSVDSGWDDLVSLDDLPVAPETEPCAA
ncbi:hypothetical protein QBC35DRAFT_244520 [Podospora australis]|uniref:Uncharacterized protein n=1 Tax=Podospora australis TaxID=1536484 RepID=A0AAN6X2W5_9PEZI|nr:hypothetical protein QBC35DRAFT_244520 [Podospora australis]